MKRVEEFRAGAVSQHCTMEAETISKNGRTSKSQTSRNLTLLTAVLALVVVFAACRKEDPVIVPVVKAAPAMEAYCGDATVVELSNVGTVTVGNDEDFLYVTFNLSLGKIQRTHLYVGVVAPTGNPNSYPNRVSHSAAVTYTYVFPLTYLPGETIWIAPYAQVTSGSNVDAAFEYVIQECEQEEDEDDPVLGTKHSSVTATNGNFIVPNSNHFTYAKLDYDALINGQSIELDLVEGNKLNKVGTAYVTLQNGNLVVSIKDFGTGKFGIVTFNLGDVPKNGNIHSMNSFKHNDAFTVPCPSPDALGLIYMYIHCDNIRFYK